MTEEVQRSNTLSEDEQSSMNRSKEARRRRGNSPGLSGSPGGDNGRQNMMHTLSNQLEYYFSETNLESDTFLKTIMSLNAGHVPTTVLANFVNVNRIIGKYDPYGDLIVSEGLGVPGLVREAASLSDKLKIVTLTIEGEVIEDNGDTVGVTFSGIGPLSEDGTNVADAPKSSPHKKQREPIQAPLSPHPSKKSIEPEKCTIIVRDVPTDTTEEDVRSLFTPLIDESKCSPVHSVHSDVANCWFVTLEPTSKEELVTILLALRNKNIRGQPVKARLKTESQVKSFYIESAPTAPVAMENGEAGGRRPYLGGGHTEAAQQIYSGDRSGLGSFAGVTVESQAKQSESVPTSPMGGDVYRKGRPFGTPFGNRTRGGRGSVRRSGGDETGPSFSKVTKVSNVPMPPLLDSHFPALGGESDEDDLPPSSLPEQVPGNPGVDGEDAVVDEKAVEPKRLSPVAPVFEAPTKAGKNVAVSHLDVKTPGGGYPTVPVGGYAAALMKAALPKSLSQSPPKQVSGKNGAISSNHKPNKGRKGNEAKSGVNGGEKGPSSKASVAATASTASDDMSADGKLSVSSKPELDKGSPVAIATPTWGMGKSFADILKKPEKTATSVKQLSH